DSIHRARASRAAWSRLRALLQSARLRAEEQRRLSEALGAVWPVESAYERTTLCRMMGGRLGKAVREEDEEWRRLLAGLPVAIAAYWDMHEVREPLLALSGEERALVLSRVRDLPDAVLAHLAALIEGGDPGVDVAQRAQLLSSLRHAADPRLVAALMQVLVSAQPELWLDAAQSLAAVVDARVLGALAHAYDRALDDEAKLALAGALAQQGDRRAASYVRVLLRKGHVRFWPAALRVLGALGEERDQRLALRCIEHADPQVQRAAVWALGQLGDRKVGAVLRRLQTSTTPAALRAAVDEALMTVRARLELRGEEVQEVDPEWSMQRPVPVLARPAPRSRIVRLRAWLDWRLGYGWLALGARERAVARFERAALRLPDWCPPLLALALVFARQRQDARALTEFRRALGASAHEVQRHPRALKAFAACVLRRAEALEQAGRPEIAQGLLHEALSLDLRRAPAALRFELERRLTALRRRLG
ncbi:MAG: HEAT repeat domain-containing protein, partial [Polyangiales bacterium]